MKELQPESAAQVAEVREGFLEEGEAPWTCRILDIRRERGEHLPPIAL